jgi:hypothetical protein
MIIKRMRRYSYGGTRNHEDEARGTVPAVIRNRRETARTPTTAAVGCAESSLTVQRIIEGNRHVRVRHLFFIEPTRY